MAGQDPPYCVMPSIFHQYFELTKPRVVALIVFTALVGMFLAVPGWPPLRGTVFGLLGIWLAAASAAAINHLIDQRIDKVMARTANRPLATGTLKPAQVLAFAVFLGTASMTILIALVNPLTAALTFASLIGYAIVYTGFLKRATPQNIVIGGIAGAAPPLLGWAAVTNMQGPWDWSYAWLLVLIILTHGVQYTRWQILLYTVLLFVVTMLPVVFGMSGWFYLGGAIVLGVVFLWYAWKLMDPPDEFFAMRVFGYSIVYLMALFAFLLLDHWLLPFLQPAAGFELRPI